jgi:hypothetical protein
MNISYHKYQHPRHGRASAPQTAALAGALEYRTKKNPSSLKQTLANALFKKSQRTA